jgi:EcsC family protein
MFTREGGGHDMEWRSDDIDDLRHAKYLLENPGLAAKLVNLIGVPLQRGFDLLPDRWRGTIQEATERSLNKCLGIALKTMGGSSNRSYDAVHTVAVAGTGAVGGFFGLGALAIELPISTGIMLRSIADVARSEGENLRLIQGRLACLEVFALGGRNSSDDAAEHGYFAVRTALARSVTEAAEFIIEKGLAEEGAPVLVRFITRIASRFSVTVSEKAAAQAVPAIGAAGGALINTLFIAHFQDMARGHFVVRRLERHYGSDEVQRKYEVL